MIKTLPTWALKVLPVLVLVITALSFTPLLFKESVPDFSSFPAGKERKQAFVDYLLPRIEAQNSGVAEQRQQLQAWQQDFQQDGLGWWGRRQLAQLAEDYGVADFNPETSSQWSELLRRVDQIPPSMVIAQAANESAWGTSRFAREGYNYFGQWCYEKGCGLVPTQRGADQHHEVKVFDSPVDSLQGYFFNINTHRAYAEFRQLRSQQRGAEQRVSGLELIVGLENYSERGMAYVSDLRGMIRYNNFDRFDQVLHRID